MSRENAVADNPSVHELVGMVSHELRTPGRRFLRLIEDLLEAAQLDHEPAGPLGEEVDVAAEVHEVARTYADAFGSIDVVGPESCHVIADADILQQILVNLIDNAYKYGEPPIRVEVERTDHHVVMSVLDSGPGVPPPARERIFERFTRLEPNGDRPGIGLGLPIVRQLVGACGGRVWVDDAPGGGAAFRVALPLPESASAGADAIAAHA
jgi:signal transduction histidine kinase